MTSTHLLIGIVSLAMLSWLRARREPGSAGPWIGVMLGLALATELSAAVLRNLLHAPNTSLYNVYVGLEFILFMRIATLSAPVGRAWTIMSMVVGLGALAGSWWVHRDETFLLTEGILIVSTITAVWSIRVLWYLAQQEDRPLWQRPLFWFFTGTMVYFGCIVPVVGMLRFLFQDSQGEHRFLYEIITISAMLRYLMAAISCHLAVRYRGWSDEQR
ncbi:MAG: hypothetical protein JST41_08070 [Bacteroidetes bacterium]|nr:hypothetical protein [Bacteroidota bacterium]HMU13509.1 hypothetical protein [Flavobacteriales bacterium]